MFYLKIDLDEGIIEVKKENNQPMNEKTIEEDIKTRDSPEAFSRGETSDIKLKSETTVPHSPAKSSSPEPTQRKDIHITSNSVEDSPVKSLRKWVDGCFVQRDSNMSSCPSSVQSARVEHQSPPSTPPQRSSTETSVIYTGKMANSKSQC